MLRGAAIWEDGVVLIVPFWGRGGGLGGIFKFKRGSGFVMASFFLV